VLEDVREYIDRLQIEGYSVGEDHDDDPVLIDPTGRAVDTWRENYPYDERMDRNEYDEQKYLLSNCSSCRTTSTSPVRST
jgi:hypothetical protein